MKVRNKYKPLQEIQKILILGVDQFDNIHVIKLIWDNSDNRTAD